MEISQDLTPSALVEAIEANIWAYYTYFGSWSRVELHDDPELLWGITDIPYPLFNMAMRARLGPEEADAAIQAAIGRCRVRRVPMMWLVGPASRPAGLGQRLVADGFVHIGDEPGMAADLLALNEGVPTPPDLSIERVGEEGAMREFADVQAVAFEMPGFAADAIYEFGCEVLGDPQSPMRVYIGRLKGEAVAASLLQLGAGVAGISNVATLPQARRQGIGSAMTLAALLEARALGYRVGTLRASQMGIGVYRRLGFREYCRVGYYVWAG